MNTFVVSDIHGHYSALWSLLNQEGLVDDEENRTELGKETFIVSVGDLLNAVLEDITGDELCASVAEKWFDKLIVGNHEWPYLYDTAGFAGYYPHPPLRMLYNMWKRQGFVIPALVVGNTLVSHAGWAAWPYASEVEDKEAWEPKTAEEALVRIGNAWRDYPNTDDRLVLDGIGRKRGGWNPIGGILWSDFNDEPKIKTFSQVMGHTPNYKGPVLHEREDGTFTLCIDTGCKGKTPGLPTGVWLDADGQIIKIVQVERDPVAAV